MPGRPLDDGRGTEDSQVSRPLPNPRHELFAQALARGETADAAYVIAGYVENRGNATRLNANESVQLRLAEILGRAAAKTEITAARVLEELAKIAFSDLADVADWGVKEIAFGFDGDGKQLRPEDIGEAAMVRYAEAPFLRLVDRDALTPAARAAVSEVALTKDGFRIKMHDKGAALNLLARHVGLLGDEGGGPTITVNVAVVDAPPAETREQWLERKARELALTDDRGR